MKKAFFGFFLAVLFVSCDSELASSYVDPWEKVPRPCYYSEVYYDQFGYVNTNGIYQMNEIGGLSFKGSSNSDGFIPDGKVTLYTIGGISKTFKCYKKGTKRYAFYCGVYYELSGTYLTIDNLKFKL